MDTIYNSEFFKTDCGLDYRESAHWDNFFGGIADKIIEIFNPKSVLDAGCAFGYLVKALRDRGVDAYGFDVSEYAISMSDESIKDYVAVHSITEPLPEQFPKKFDLVITIEVLEHLMPEDGEKAIANLCNYSDTILFTSTPSDIDNRTHFNVRLAEYWASVFAKNSFYHDLIQDVSFITSHAMLFMKKESFTEVVFNYELNRRIEQLHFDKAIEKIKAESSKNTAFIYFSSDGNFSDENKITAEFCGAHLNLPKTHLPAGTRFLRFDPADDKPCFVMNLLAVTDLGELSFAPENSSAAINGVDFFEESDCRYTARSAAEIRWICVECDIIALASPEGVVLLNKLSGEFAALKNNVADKENAIAAKQSEYASMLADMNNRLAALNIEKENECAEIRRESAEKLSALAAEKDAECARIRTEAEQKLIALAEEKDNEYEEICAELTAKIKELDEKSSALFSEKKSCKAELDSVSAELAHYKEHYSAAINQREDLKRQLADANNALEISRMQFNTINGAFFWKITFPARKIVDGLKWLFWRNKAAKLFRKGCSSLRSNGVRATWKKVKRKLSPNARIQHYVSSCTLSAAERSAQENTVFEKKIKFSILVPLYNTPINFLEEMIGSVVAQTYGNWELCLADGSDSKHGNVETEVKKIMRKDSRIKYKKLKKNLGISENTNACIDMSTGDYIALFDHDDILHPSALFEVMKAVCEKDADFVYTDEAVFESPDINNIKAIHFKSDYAVDTLRSVNYICHFTSFSRSLLDKTGKFRPEYDGSQDHDLVLRLTANAKSIVHIPKILYYWRSHPLSVASDIGSKTYAINAGINAVKDNISAAGLTAVVESSRACPTWYRIKYDIKSKSKVSIIIPNKNHLDDLRKCLNSILEKSTYPNYEVVIVDNGSDDKALFEYYDYLKQDKRFVICSLDIEFNYSRLNNFAAKKASGKYYILLNNDIEIITPEWIEEMLMYVQRDDVGAAGAMLYYPDDTIQHAGVIVGLGGIAGHCFGREPRGAIGYLGRITYAQDLSAVTAACMMVKASVYKKVGGLDEGFKVAYNDVDLCMKIRREGYLIVWTPYCEAYHYESKSRGYEDTPEKLERFNAEKKRFQKKWRKELDDGDPYYNPNLTLDRGDFSLK